MNVRPFAGLLLLSVSCLLVFLAAASGQAAKPDATGIWKWTVTSPDGQTWDSSAALKQEGEKLTGTVKGRDGTDAPIVNGTIKNNEIAFTVNRDFGGNVITIKQTGKLDGDSIKGKIEINFGGEPLSFDWDAKRAKDAPATKPS